MLSPSSPRALGLWEGAYGTGEASPWLVRARKGGLLLLLLQSSLASLAGSTGASLASGHHRRGVS